MWLSAFECPLVTAHPLLTLKSSAIMPPPYACERRNIQESEPKAVESTDSHFDRSPHAPNVFIPLDILLLILDAVEEGWSPQIYASCARTSRAMLRPSQVRMYRNVLINQPHHFTSFSRTMLGNMDLALLVKKLIADVDTGWPAVQDLPADQLLLSSNAISRLQNLQELTVIGLCPNIFHPKQAMSSPVIERFLGAFAASCSKLRCLRLKQLELQEYAGLVRHIVSFPEMETLELDCVTWTRHGRLRAPERYIRDGACTNLHTLKVSAVHLSLAAADGGAYPADIILRHTPSQSLELHNIFRLGHLDTTARHTRPPHEAPQRRVKTQHPSPALAHS